MQLIRLFRLRESLTDDDRERLHMMQHSKEFLSSAGRRDPSIERAIQELGRTPSTVLYRGLAAGDDLDLDAKIFRAHGYLSFSEDRGTAEKFAGDTGVILELTRFRRPAFCYWAWICDEMEDLRRQDPSAFEDSDGDWVIQAAREESEWILPFDASFRRLGSSPDGGRTVVRVEGL